MNILHRAHKAVSYVLLMKSMVGFSVAALALFGVSVPYLGVESSIASESAAAGAGALIGALVALKA
ncbi:hypothetical protein JZX86_18040 [Agrobacterium rosae]|uniref:hypothetical protein n=1 Tax=Agrobacterium rosae TaxID=1972867 RepID=UPI0019D3C96B|nr:hypothetical protein [Agrobacterium rosae]MBN7807257.1 hypothetical protein [Agrobacterium rosae]